MNKIAVISSNGSEPVVTGMGDTLDQAVNEAILMNDHGSGWASHGWTSLEVTPEIEERILAGEVSARELGIHVRLDRQGHIIDAWMMSENKEST